MIFHSLYIEVNCANFASLKDGESSKCHGLSIIDNFCLYSSCKPRSAPASVLNIGSVLIARKSYVDSSLSVTTPLHICCPVHSAVDYGPGDNSAYSDGHLSQHRHSRGEHYLAVHWALCRPDVWPYCDFDGTHAEHDGQQH